MSDSEMIQNAMMAKLRAGRRAMDLAKLELVRLARIYMDVESVPLASVLDALGVSERTWYRWLAEYRRWLADYRDSSSEV